MSNLHKDLLNDQIHNPKDFDTAAVSTKLTKNGSGNLEWVADTHPTDAVSQIIAGTNVTVSPVSGVGAVTVNSTGGSSEQVVAVHNRCYGAGETISGGNYFCMTAPSGNNEHKFTVDLGSSSPTTISPKDTVQGAIYSATEVETPIRWVGHVYGNADTVVTFAIGHVTWGDCQSEGDTLAMCIVGETDALGLTGNSTPICFDVSTFSEECETVVIGDVYVLMAKIEGDGNFTVETTVRLTT